MKNLSNSKDMARTKQSIDLENNNIVYNDTLYSLSVNRVASEGQNKDPQSRDITGKFVDSLKFDPGISHIQNSSLPDNPKGTAETDYQAFVSNECREISSENMKQYNMNQLKSSEWHSSFLIEHVGVNSATQSPLRFHLEHEAIQTQTAGTCTLEQGEDKPTLGSSFEEFNNSSQSQHIEDHRIVDDSADSGVLDLNGIYGYNVPSIGSSPSNLQPQENNRASFCHMNSPLSNVQKGVPITSNSELLNRSSELAAEIVASVENEEAGCFRARNSSFEFRVSKTNVPCLSEGLSSPEAKDDGLSTQILHSDDHQTFIKDMSIHFNSTIPIELAISNTPHQSNSHHDSPLMAPILISKINESLKSNFGGLLPKMETKDCCIEHKLATPFSQNVEMQSLSTADAALHCTFESDASSLLSSRAWKHEIRTEPSGCIPDEEILEGALDGNNSDGISDNENQMDCSESPCPSFSLQEDNPDELEEVGTRACYNFTSEDGVLKSNKKLANGSVNSCRRKRVRSLGACTEASQKVFKRMKLMPAERDVLNKDEGFMCLGFSKSPALGPNSRSFNRFSHFSPIRKFIKLECSTKSLEPQEMDGIKLSKSYSRLPILRKDYVDTPNMRPAKGVIDRVVNKSKLECHLESHLEKDEKENHYPEALIRAKRYSNISLHSDIQTTVISRKVLTNANHSFGAVESPQKCHHLTGKRDLRVKALEAAENARKQEEKRENGRRLRRLESNDAKSMDSELIKDKQHNFSFAVVGKGVTEKVKRVADLKMKMDQEKARKQEMEQRKKEEERKKKEAEFADKKRKREEAERRDREEKRKRVEEVQRLRREQEERQRIELEEKELKRKMLEERERERKAQEEEAKKQRRLEKEKEAERRRRHDQDLKAARLIEKQVERKRKEVIVQAKGNEDDESTVHVVRENKLSYMSMESFTVNSSMDLGTKAKSKIRTRSQMSEDNWRLRVLSCGISAYSQKSSEKLMSVVENEPDVPFQPIMSGRDPKSEMLKNKTLSHSTPSNNMGIGLCMPAQSMSSAAEIQSYEISPYRSSSDDDDEDDDQPKKPVPLWARKENLLQQLEWQQGIDPDRIFSTEKTCSLAEIFGTTGSRRRRNFMQRSTSGDWLEDHATWKEQLEYKKAMGYI
ncbi:hypothetical protein KP509_20G079100 [Ceratopteris richardii]|nr:hypothetical protein KP509_20G079100 [Ceratopteris richardii]